mgnify:CR=1 FL=1
MRLGARYMQQGYGVIVPVLDAVSVLRVCLHDWPFLITDSVVCLSP